MSVEKLDKKHYSQRYRVKEPKPPIPTVILPAIVDPEPKSILPITKPPSPILSDPSDPKTISHESYHS